MNLSFLLGLAVGAAAVALLLWVLLFSEKRTASASREGLEREIQNLRDRTKEASNQESVLRADLANKDDRVNDLLERNSELNAENSGLKSDKYNLNEREKELKQLLEQSKEDNERLLLKAKEVLAATFAELSQESLQKSQKQFIELANETFSKHSQNAKVDLEKLVKPVHDNLEKLESLNLDLEKERLTAYGKLEIHLENLLKETDELSNAMRRPVARGAWGEQVLEQILENAGFIENEHFVIQDTTDRDEVGRLRADVVVNLPGNRKLVIDAKTPLDAFTEAMNSPTEEERRMHFERHARAVRGHVDELSRKEYWRQYDRSPDFVLLFLSTEGAFQAALEADKGLFAYAKSKRVYIAGPSSILALVHTIGLLFQESKLQQNALEVQKEAAELCQRVGVFIDHFSKVGESLGRAGASFEKARASYDRRVSPQMRRIKELGVSLDVKEVSPISGSIQALGATDDEPAAEDEPETSQEQTGEEGAD